MPHYADGTKASRGDIVRGKGYNLKDEQGDLREIVGIIVGITEGADSCNVTLLVPNDSIGYFITPRATEYGQDSLTGWIMQGQTEYGQADHFEKV